MLEIATFWYLFHHNFVKSSIFEKLYFLKILTTVIQWKSNKKDILLFWRIHWINWNQILKPKIILLFLEFFMKSDFVILAFFEKIWLNYQCLQKNWLVGFCFLSFFVFRLSNGQIKYLQFFSAKLSCSAHRTPNFANPEFKFPQFKVLQSVFFNIKSYIGIFGFILISI